MSPSSSADFGTGHEPSPEEMMSALFANLVIQHTNTALVLIGRAPNPETGERIQDLEAARLFIDQLEMLEVKTKGNLTKDEGQLLQQSLTTLRMAFVEAVESPSESAVRPSTTPASAPSSAAASETSGAAAPASEEEHRKKFSKKY